MIRRLEWISLNTSCWLTNSLPLLAPINVFFRTLMFASALHKILLMTGWFLYNAIRLIHFFWFHSLIDFLIKLKIRFFYLYLLMLYFPEDYLICLTSNMSQYLGLLCRTNLFWAHHFKIFIKYCNKSDWLA